MAGTFDEFLQEMEAAGKSAAAKPEEPVVAPAPVVVAAPPPAPPKRKKAARPPGPPVTALAATVQPEPQKVPASVEDFGTPPEVLRELDYKKFYDVADLSSYGVSLREASRTQGVSAKALEEAAQKQGVNLEEIYNARKKGRSFDEIAKANRERGVLGFMPVEERDAAFKQTMKKVDDAQKGIASDEVDLRAAAKSTSYALAGTHEALPEVTKPGEHGYETAQLLVEALKKDPEQSRIYDLYGRAVSTGATNKYIEERAEQLRKRAGLNAGSPDALEKAAKYRRQATNEVLAYKTIGQWTPAVILQDVEITEGRKAPGVVGGLMPNIELIGVNNKGQAIFRQESGLGVLLRAIDLPQAAFTGWLEGEGAGRGVQTGANLMEYAMDHTEGSSPWVRYPAIAAGGLASVAFPDMFMAGGLAGKAAKAGLAEIKVAKNTPKVLDLLETAAKARAASDFTAATRAESEIRELLPIAADSLDQYDNATARIAVIKDPKQDILNDDIAELIAANVPTVEAAEFAASRSWLHPSVRRETTAVKRATKTVEKVGYDEAYDTRRLLDRVRNVRQSYLDSAPKTLEEYARFRAKGITKDLLTALPDTFVERIGRGELLELSAGDIDEIARIVEGVAPEALTDMKKFRTSVDAALKAHKKFGTDAYEAYRTFLREPGRHSLMSRMERRVKDAAGKTIAELQAPDLELIDRAQKAIEKNNELRGLAAALLREKIAADRKIVVQPLSLFDDVAPVGSDGKPLRLSPGGHRFLAQLREVYPDADIKDLYNATAMLDAKILAEAKRLKRDPYLVWAESASVGKATPQEEVTFGGKLGAPTPAAPPPAAPLAPPISAAERAAAADRAEAEAANAYYAARAAAAAEAAARQPVIAALAWKPTLPAGTPVRDIAELADAKKLIQAALKGELPDGAALATFNGPDGAVASTVAVGDVRITWGSSKKTGQFGAQYRVGGNSGIIEGKATAEEALKAAQSKAYAQMGARAKRGEPALRNAPDFEVLKPAATAPAPTPPVAPPTPAAAAPLVAEGRSFASVDEFKQAIVDAGGEGFRTKGGSVYQVSGAQTQRFKADHTKMGHAKADVGVKRPSKRTIYLDATAEGKGPRRVSTFGLDFGEDISVRWLIDDQTKQAYLASRYRDAAPEFGVDALRKVDGQPAFAVTFSETPVAGWTPLELFDDAAPVRVKTKDGSIDLPGHKSFHPGTEIDEVFAAPAPSKAPPPTEAVTAAEVAPTPTAALPAAPTPITEVVEAPAEAAKIVEAPPVEAPKPAVRVSDAEIEKAPEVKKAMKARQAAANKLKIAQGKAAEATGKQAAKATEALRTAEKADEEAEIAYQAVRNQTEARLTAAAEKQPGLFPAPATAPAEAPARVAVEQLSMAEWRARLQQEAADRIARTEAKLAERPELNAEIGDAQRNIRWQETDGKTVAQTGRFSFTITSYKSRSKKNPFYYNLDVTVPDETEPRRKFIGNYKSLDEAKAAAATHRIDLADAILEVEAAQAARKAQAEADVAKAARVKAAQAAAERSPDTAQAAAEATSSQRARQATLKEVEDIGVERVPGEQALPEELFVRENDGEWVDPRLVNKKFTGLKFLSRPRKGRSAMEMLDLVERANGDLAAAVREIAATTTVPEFKAVADRILQLEDEVRESSLRLIRPGDPAAQSGIDAGAAGWYSPADNSVNLFGPEYTSYALSEETLLHETLHALTHKRLTPVDALTFHRRAVITAESRAALREGQRAIQQVHRDLVEHIRNAKIAGTATPFEQSVAMSDYLLGYSPDELISWAMTDAGFQDYLKTVKLPKQAATLWQKFVRAMGMILGFDIDETSALARVIEATDQLLDAKYERVPNVTLELTRATEESAAKLQVSYEIFKQSEYSILRLGRRGAVLGVSQDDLGRAVEAGRRFRTDSFRAVSEWFPSQFHKALQRGDIAEARRAAEMAVTAEEAAFEAGLKELPDVVVPPRRAEQQSTTLHAALRAEFRAQTARASEQLEKALTDLESAAKTTTFAPVEVSEKPLASKIFLSAETAVREPSVPQTETPAFKNWFGDSKVVDDAGKPLVVYHGTVDSTFEAFDPARVAADSMYGPGFYFTDSPAEASTYVGRWPPKGGVYPVYLSVKNPFDLTIPLASDTARKIEDVLRSRENGEAAADLLRGYVNSGKARDAGDVYAGLIEQFPQSELSQVLSDAGYDGIVYRGAVFPGEPEHRVFIAFRPEQIKSAIGNVGTFDPNEPSILRSIERDARRVDAERAARKRLADIMIADAVGMNIAQEYEQIPEAFRVAAGRRLRKAAEGLEAGKITEQDYKKLVAAVTSDLEDQAELRRARATRGPVRGADWVRSRLLAAKSQGALDEAGVDLADWFIRQNPAIAEDLAVSIRKGGEGATAGFYDRMGKLVTLLKGKGTELTATHEVLHHTERMLPAALQDGIRKEWRKRLVAALKTATPQQRPFLEKMLTGADAEGVVKAFENGTLPNAFYQYANPSEFWAVNASEIVAGRYAAFNAGFVAKAKRWLTEFVQKAKSIFGLQSDAPLIRGLDAVLKGDGTFVSKQMLTNRSIFKSIGQAPPPAMPTNVIRLTNPSGEVKGIVETMEDGRNIIKLFRGADPSVVIRGVGVVLRRTALSNSDMVKVTSWLRGLGIQVSHQYGEFTGSPAEVQRAEEAFGKALEQYVIEGQTANPTLLPVLDHLKNTLLNTYRAVSDPVIGVPLDAGVRQVFEAALADTAEQPMSSVKDLLRKQLLGLEQDDIGFLETLSKEAQRKGIPSTTVEELRAAFDAAVKGGAKAEDTHLSFPVPVLGKKDWSLDDLARAQAKAEMGRVVEKARAKGLQINLKAAKRGTAGLPEEETAVEKLRSALQNRDADLPITKDAKKALRLVTATFFGGDVIGENAARYFPPEMRRALDTAARIVEQSIGDSVSLVNDAIHAKKDTELIRYLAGDSDIRRLAGRPIVSAGHDYMGSVLNVWRRVAANLEPEELSALRDFAEMLDTAPSYSEYTRRLATFGFRPEDVEGESLARRIKSFRRAEKTEEARGQALVSAIDKFLFLKGGEDADFGQALGQALRAAIGTPKNIPQIPNEMRLMETIAYLSGVSARKVGAADPVMFKGTSAEAARVLLGAEGVKHSIGDLFGEEALRRVAVIVGAYGSADLAKTHLVGMDLGLSTEAYKAFENWSQGRAWDPKYSEDIQRIVDRYGYNPDFINDATLDVDFYIPRAARERLSMALARATYRPSDIAGPGAMVNTLYRYMKQRMTRGSFFLRPRYYMMNTVDHFMQTAMTSGVGVAAASVTRVIAQDIMVLPFWQQVVDAVTRVPGVKRLPVVGKYATPDALERFRAGLQKLGDRGAQNIATLFGVSKYRIEVNPILEGLDGGFRVGDKFYSYRAVRDVAVQEGVFASFDTRQLANAIEREGALVIRQQVDGLSDLVSAAEKGTVVSGGGKIRDFFAGWQETVRDTAEAWGERERLGAMVTLMEAGYDPRTAARLTIDALYDYSQSMTKADRSLLVGIMFPFWAFQKNANAQIFNLMFSPWGAYRMMCLERARERGADLLAEILYNDVGSEYDLDVKSMPPELQDTYYSIITAFEQAYDGTPPLEAKRALRMLFANRARDVEEGKLVQLTPDMLRLRDSRALSEITRKFAPYIQMRPSKSERMTYLRDREGIPVPFPRTTAVQWYNKLLGDQHSYLEYYLPESTIETGMRHMTQITAAYMLLGSMPIDWMLRSGQSLGLYSGPTLTERGTEEVKLTRQIGAFFDPARSPFIGPILADISSDYVPAKKVALKLGQGVAAATKVHPMIGKIMDDMFGTTFLRVEAKNDPFVIAAADGDFSRLSPEMVAEIKALQAEYPDVGKLRDQRYYINGGVWSTLFENSPLGELNAQLLNWEESPAERANIRGKILAWARAVIGADVAEVSATKTMKAEEPTKMKETKGI